MSSTLRVLDAGLDVAAYVSAQTPFSLSSEFQQIEPFAVGDPPVVVWLTANGVSPLFSFAPIEGLRDDNVVVTTVASDRTETVMVLGVDYVLAPFGVIFTTPPANGIVVVIQRVEPLIQPDVYRTNTPFPASETGRRLTRIVYGLQHLSERFSRTLRVPLGDLRLPQLPLKGARLNRLLSFDAAGDPTTSPGKPMSGVSGAETGLKLAGAVNAAAGRAAIEAASSADLAAVDAGVVKKAGDTMTGDLVVDRSAPELRLRSSSPSTRVLRFQTGSNSRLLIGVSSASETGGSAGSNPFMQRVLDDGTGVDFLVVERASGRVRIEGSVPLRLPGATPYSDDDAATKSYMDRFGWVDGGSVSASGASVTISGIPPLAREIVVNLHQVASNGTQPLLVQLGVNGVFDGAYNSSAMRAGGTAVACSNATTGFMLNKHTAATSQSGFIRMTRFSPQAPNVWQAMGQVSLDTVGSLIMTSGHCILTASPLSHIRIACVGSDTFTSGVFNVMWRT